MEDLNLNSKNKYKLKKDGVNYRNIIKVLYFLGFLFFVLRSSNHSNVIL